MNRDHQQPSAAVPLAIRLGPDTTMTLRFVAEPTRRRSSLQPPQRPAESGTQETPAGSGYPSA